MNLVVMASNARGGDIALPRVRFILRERQPEFARLHQPLQILPPDGLRVSLDDIGECRDGDKIPLTNPDQCGLHGAALQPLLLAWLPGQLKELLSHGLSQVSHIIDIGGVKMFRY